MIRPLLAGILAFWLSAGGMSLADVSRATVALGKQATAYVETEIGSGVGGSVLRPVAIL